MGGPWGRIKGQAVVAGGGAGTVLLAAPSRQRRLFAAATTRRFIPCGNQFEAEPKGLLSGGSGRVRRCRAAKPFEIDGEKARAGVDVFVAGHGNASEGNALMTLDIPNGSPQNAGMNELFLQHR